MRVALHEILRRQKLRAASPHAEHAGRRNVTLSPRDGTRVIAVPRSPSPSTAGAAHAIATT